MEVNVVVDELFAEIAEKFAGAVVAAVGGAIEFELALSGEAPAVAGRGDEDGEFQRAGYPAEGEGAAQNIVRRTFGAVGDFLRGGGGEPGGGMVRDVEEIGGVQMSDGSPGRRGLRRRCWPYRQ